MKEQINSLRDSLEKSNNELTEINKKIPMRSSLIKSIKGFFGSKTNVS